MWKSYKTILDRILWLVRMAYQFLHLSEEVNFLPGKGSSLFPLCQEGQSVRLC